MDLTNTPEQTPLRAEVRAFLKASLPPCILSGAD